MALLQGALDNTHNDRFRRGRLVGGGRGAGKGVAGSYCVCNVSVTEGWAGVGRERAR